MKTNNTSRIEGDTSHRINTLHDNIQSGSLKKISIREHPVFSQLNNSGRLVIENLQNNLFLSNVPFGSNSETHYIIEICRSGEQNTNILLDGGFGRKRNTKTLDFFLLCESLFEEISEAEIEAYDDPNINLVRLLTND